MGGCAGKPKDLDSSRSKAPGPKSSPARAPAPAPAPANNANNAKFQSIDQTKADKKISVDSPRGNSTEQTFVDAPETPFSPHADENGQQGAFTENKPLSLRPGKTAEVKIIDSVEKPKANAKETTTKDDKKQAP